MSATSKVSIEALLSELTDAGLCVSFAYGPSATRGVCWSVDVLNAKTGESFDRPFAANGIRHACKIALIESRAAGWIQ